MNQIFGENLILERRVGGVWAGSKLVLPILLSSSESGDDNMESRDNRGCAALSLDDDGPLHTILSRDKHVPLEQRLQNIREMIHQLAKIYDPFGVALCVEDLAPGGLDPTDGIFIAQSAESAGAQFIIASCGTKDFPALKWRRETKRKNDTGQTADSWATEPWIASAAWLLGRVKIPVFAQGPVSDWGTSNALCKTLGLSGVICAARESHLPVNHDMIG